MVSRGGCASLVEVSDNGVSWKCDNYVRDGGGQRWVERKFAAIAEKSRYVDVGKG